MNANAYVAAGYGALAGILLLYVAHLRHRARVLAAALAPPRLRPPARTGSTAGAASTVGAGSTVPAGGADSGGTSDFPGERA